MINHSNPPGLIARLFDKKPIEVLLESEIVGNSFRLILTRWVAGVGVFIATAVCTHLLHLPLPELLLYITGSAILLYNALLTWLIVRISRADEPQQQVQVSHLVTLQVALDWASMAIFVHLTGGITSPAIPFFLIHMLMVAILLPGQSPYIYVGLGIGALGLVVALEWVRWLPHYVVIPALPATLHTDPVYVAAQMSFISIIAAAGVYLAATIVNEVHARERQIATLLQTTQAVSSTLSLQAVLDRLASSAAKALSKPGAAIRLLNASRERLEMSASHGLSQSYLDKGPIELAHSAIDQAAIMGQSVIVSETADDARLQYPQQVLAEGIRSILAVPIIGREGPLGVLRVYSRLPNDFTEKDAVFVIAIARQGATAIENALVHDALQKSEQERAEFVRIVTHELRSPVTGAQSLLRVLLKEMLGTLNEQQSDILSRIERRLDVLYNLINDLLALAASKTTMMQEASQPLPLKPIINQVIDMLSTQAEEKQICLKYSAPKRELIVTASSDGLTRIFENLISNAIKYTPDGGSVTIAVEEVPAGVTITVADTGIGIPSEDLPNLWNEFFRARNARESQIVGTGLGLSITKRLVERYQGVISVQSAEKQGTRFSVTLPLAMPVPAES
jgi:signal transduction histidine kinase